MKTDLRWIFSAMGKLKRLYFPLVLLSMLSAALTVLFALSVKDLVNSAVSSGGYDRLNFCSSVSFLLLIASILVSLCNKLLSDRCRFMFETKLKNETFLSLIDKDYLALSKYRSGDVLSRIQRDCEIVASGITVLPTLASMVIKIVLSVAILLGLQPIFTLVLLCIGGVCVLLSLVFRKYFKKLHKRTREADSRVTSFLNEGFNNIIALKVFSSKDKLKNSVNDLTDKYRSALLKQRNLFTLIVSAFSFGFTSLYLATLVWGGIGLIRNDGAMSFGLIVSMIQLISILQLPFANITGVFSSLYETLSSVDRLQEIENLSDEEITTAADVSLYDSVLKICAQNLSFDYGRERVFNQADFCIEKGDICLIKGRSGIGKSTLFKLLLGVLKATEGQLYFQCENGKLDIDSSTRSLFSYVPQGNMLFYGTIKENICMLCQSATDEEIAKIIDICALDFIYDFKDGLKTVIGEGGQGLSEGQAQRVAIARALLSKRPIILLDEATSALDSVAEARLLENIKKSAKYMTVIMISHRPMPKNIANRILTVADNKIFDQTDLFLD